MLVNLLKNLKWKQSDQNQTFITSKDFKKKLFLFLPLAFPNVNGKIFEKVLKTYGRTYAAFIGSSRQKQASTTSRKLNISSDSKKKMIPTFEQS